MSDQVQVKLPLGCRFVPIDEEVIIYLKKKINNEPLPYNGIRTINIYKYHPWELAEMYSSSGKDELYFFTSRDRKYPNGSRPDRAAGDGYWKATVADQRIYDNNNDCIGFKKTLVFYQGKARNCKKTNWIMHEYTLDHPPRHLTGTTNDNMRLDNCVLCRIHERKQADSRKTIHEPNLPLQQNLPLRQDIQGQHNLQVQPPNLPMQQQNLQAIQCSLMAENHNLTGQLDYHLQSAAGEAGQIHYDHPENSLEAFNERIQGDASDSRETINEPNLPMHQYLPHIQGQCNIQVQPPNLPMMQQNLQAIQCSLMAGNHNLGGQLDYRLQSAAGEAGRIHYDNPENSLEAFNERIQGDASDSRETINEPNLPMHQNLPHIQGQCNIQVQPPNLPMMQQHLQAIQCSLMAGNHNLGGQLDYRLQSAAGEAGQIQYDHPENSLEAFNDLISIDMVGHQTYPSVFNSGFGHFTLPDQNFKDFDLDSLMDCFTLPDQDFNDFGLDSLMDCFEPNPPSFNNNDHPHMVID